MGDPACAQKILKQSDPKKIKALGRQVKNWNQELWDQNKVTIVTEGLRAKFEQNPILAEKLRATGQTTLVEAAHYDRIWGIGLRATHPDAKKPDQWLGQNLLGKCLMQVRQAI